MTTPPITYIRSTIFHLLFILANTLFCIFYLWALILPRKWAWAVLVYGYFTPLYYLEKFVLNLDYQVIGKENLPDHGPYIVTMKHQSMYETLKLFHLFGDIRIIFKKQLKWLPLWGWYIVKIQMISVDRGNKAAMQSLLDNAAPVVKQGHSIIIYPQGTRVSIHDTEKERPYKHGAIKLYSHFNIPIIPVAMNAGKFWPKHAFLIQPGVVTFKILPAIPVGLSAEEAFKRMKDAIETESRKLL